MIKTGQYEAAQWMKTIPKREIAERNTKQKTGAEQSSLPPPPPPSPPLPPIRQSLKYKENESQPQKNENWRK